MERGLIADYEKILGEIVEQLTPNNHRLAVELAMIPEKIRGFGPVKQRHLVAAKAEESLVVAAEEIGDAVREARALLPEQQRAAARQGQLVLDVTRFPIRSCSVDRVMSTTTKSPTFTPPAGTSTLRALRTSSTWLM